MSEHRAIIRTQFIIQSDLRMNIDKIVSLVKDTFTRNRCEINDIWNLKQIKIDNKNLYSFEVEMSSTECEKYLDSQNAIKVQNEILGQIRDLRISRLNCVVKDCNIVEVETKFEYDRIAV